MIYLCDILLSSQALPEEREKNKTELMKKIQLIVEKMEVKSLDEKKLSYSINKDDYLFLELTTNSQKIRQVEEILKKSLFISQHLLINLDKESKIKQNRFIKKSEPIKEGN